MRQSIFVSPGAEAAYGTDSKFAEIRVAAKGFPRMDVGQMYLDERYMYGSQRVPERHARMRKSRRIEDDKFDLLQLGLMDALDEVSLGVALEDVEFHPRPCCLGF